MVQSQEVIESNNQKPKDLSYTGMPTNNCNMAQFRIFSHNTLTFLNCSCTYTYYTDYELCQSFVKEVNLVEPTVLYHLETAFWI